MIYFAISLYIVIGLCFSYYGTAFIRVDYRKRYASIQEPHEFLMLIYFYFCITLFWVGFVLALSFINFLEKKFHPDDKTVFSDLHSDFIIVINHHYGELENPIERW